MGTRGYVIYRYKRVRYSKYNGSDSYPEGLGVDLLNKIPKPSDGKGWEARFEKWLKESRAIMEEHISEATKDLTQKEIKKLDVVDVDGDALHFNQKSEPSLDIFIEWMYEIDLDNLCFLVNACPVYKLDYMPTPEEFVANIGENYFGHTSHVFDETSPHRYVHKTIPSPLEKDQTVLQEYTEKCQGLKSTHDLLNVNQHLSHTERLRERWLGVLVEGDLHSAWGYHYADLKLEGNGNDNGRDAIPPFSFSKLLHLIELMFRPFVYYRPHNCGKCRPPRLDGSSDVFILRRDIVGCIHNHLDHASSLKTGTYKLFQAVMKNWSTSVDEGPRLVYGVLFSGTRCALVRIDRNEGKFVHTEALQFFPGWFSSSRSTNGITAIARLGNRFDPDVLPKPYKSECIPRGAGLFKKLPLEVLINISSYLYNFDDLESFSRSCQPNLDAAKTIAQSRIYVNDSCLIEAAVNETPGRLSSFLGRNETSEQFCSVKCLFDYYGASPISFKVVDEGVQKAR